MNKIESLRLVNFQSHQDSLVEFDQGLNTILGPTDSGKTAIFRALRWALYNEPSGDYFIREGQREVEVTVTFTSGDYIKRYRTPSKNGYEVQIDGQIQVFEGFGTKVPDEVYQASKMPKISINDRQDMAINMQDQLEGPFLLTESASVKAAAIGKLVQADVIDRALGDTNLDLRRKKTDKARLEESIEEKSKALEAYAYLDDLGPRIERLEAIEKAIEEKRARQASLVDLERSLTRLRENLRIHRDLVENLKDLDKIEILRLNMEKKAKDLEKIHVLDRRYKEIQLGIREKTQVLEGLKDYEKLEDMARSLEKDLVRLHRLGILYRSYRKNQEDMKIKTGLIQGLGDLDKAATTHKTLQGKLEIYNKVQRLGEDLRAKEARIAKGKESLEALEPVEDLGQIERDLQGKNLDLQRLARLRKNLDALRKNKIQEEKTLASQDLKIEQIIRAYDQTLNEAGICPTCLRPIGDDGHSISQRLKDQK